MNKKMRFLVLGALALAIIAPLFASAQLIPCGGPGQEACTLCNLFDLAKKIIDTLTTIIAPAIAVLAFTVGGFKILMSGPNPGLRSEGMKAIRNGVIGLLIVFGSWIIVSEFILFFVGSQNVTSLAPWSQITCVPPVTPKPKPITTTVTGGRICKSNNQPITATDTTYATSQNTNRVEIIKGELGTWGTNGLCATLDQAVPLNGSKASCTSLAFLPNISKLVALRMAVDNYCLNPEPGYPCGSGTKPYVTITGGTECGHQTHGFNLTRADLEDSLALTNFIRGTAIRSGLSVLPIPTTKCEQYNIIGIQFTYEGKTGCFPTAGTHWHIAY